MSFVVAPGFTASIESQSHLWASSYVRFISSVGFPPTQYVRYTHDLKPFHVSAARSMITSSPGRMIRSEKLRQFGHAFGPEETMTSTPSGLFVTPAAARSATSAFVNFSACDWAAGPAAPLIHEYE